MKHSILIASLAFSFLPALGYGQTGTRNWVRNSISGNWVGLTDTPTDWQSAETIAASQGGNLLTIRNLLENNWAQQHTQNVPMWIGMNDLAQPGTWVWSSGEPATFNNWYPGQPDQDDGGVINPDFVNSPGLWFASNGGGRTGLIELSNLPWTDWMPPYHLPYYGHYGTCADLNGDGFSDIVIPDPQLDVLRIWLNDGLGWFSESQQVMSIQTGDPREVRTCDYDLDGDQDIVASYQNPAYGVALFINDGAGGFTFSGRWNPGGTVDAHGLRCVDMTQDGYPDILVTSTGGTVTLLVNDQAGLFVTGSTLTTGANPLFLEVADLDSDGILDFVTSNNADNTLTLFMGTGAGTFTSSGLAVGSSPRQITIADMDADGVAELLVPTDTWRIQFYKRGAGGTYTAVSQLITSGAPDTPLVGDFNLDGLLDIASTLRTGTDLELYYGTGVMQFAAPVKKNNGGAMHMVSDDVTGDSVPDLVTFGVAGSTIHHNMHTIPSPWTVSPINGHWYRETPALSWKQSGAQAKAWGGDLATVRSAIESTWLGQTFLGDGSPFWIGYTDQALEGSWLWMSGETPGFDFWEPGQPDNAGNSDWAVLVPGVANFWRDEPNTPARRGIAEVISGDCDNNGLPDVYEAALVPSLDWNGDGVLDSCSTANYCTATPTSTGTPAIMAASGTPVIVDNDFTMVANSLPMNQFGYFVMAQSTGFIPNIGGSSGNLCLGVPFYRFNKPGTGGVLYSGSAGSFSFKADLNNLPSSVSFGVGDSWYFQAWFRDSLTSNFTDGLQVMFR